MYHPIKYYFYHRQYKYTGNKLHVTPGNEIEGGETAVCVVGPDPASVPEITCKLNAANYLTETEMNSCTKLGAPRLVPITHREPRDQPLRFQSFAEHGRFWTLKGPLLWRPVLTSEKPILTNLK